MRTMPMTLVRLGSLTTLCLAVAGCPGDDGVTPTDTDDTTGSTSTSPTTSGAMSTTAGSSTTAATTTGLDSTGTGSTTAVVDSTGSGSSSTGEPAVPPEPRADTYFVREDMAPLSVDAASGVLVNDLDPSGTGLMVDAHDAMSLAGGTVTVAPDGSFDYAPPAGFFGDDQFGYTAIDGIGTTADGLVRITVGPADLALADVTGGMGGFVIEGAAAGDESGWRVSSGGDVDGDGLDDLLVSAPLAAGGLGRVWVVFGKADTAAVDLADVTLGMGGFAITGPAVGDDTGHAAAIVGDVDGDGLADILVGAPQAGTAGRAYLVHGKSDGIAVALADVAAGVGGFVMDGEGFGEDAGFAVAAAGDVDGDGLHDLLVGAPQGGPIPGGGRSYLVLGKTDTDPVLLADVYSGLGGFAMYGAGFDDNTGNSLASGRDVNGDGLDDLLIGGRLVNAGGMGNAGRCYVVFGKTNTNLVGLGTLGSGGFTIDGETDLDEACAAVDGLGDVDGDGLADVAVGAPYAQDALIIQGRVYVVFGKASSSPVLLTDVAAGVGGFVMDGEAVGDVLGTAVSAAGDFDGDGYADVLAGTTNVDIPGPFAGRGYVAFGKSDGAALPLADLTVRLGGIRLLSQSANDLLGWWVAGAGDIDGDGFPDALLSAPGVDGPAGADAGRSYVVFGGNYSGAVTHLGGPDADEIFGSGAIDAVIAGAGDDTIHGGGASDVIYGGAGDDLIGISAGQFFRIDGGGGHDTLVFEDDNVQLNLAVINDVALRDLEAIDLSGTGENVVQLEYRDLRALVGPSKTLQILGDAADAIDADLTGAGFVDMGSVGGVHTYTNGVYTLALVEPVGGIVML